MAQFHRWLKECVVVRNKCVTRYPAARIVTVFMAVTMAACRSIEGLERPDLGIEVSESHVQPTITIRYVRIRNASSVPGFGRIRVEVLDSLAEKIDEVLLNGGSPVWVPPASLGGLQGRMVPFESPALNRLLDSLIRNERSFALRAGIQTIDGDANNGDNIRTREIRPWHRITPGEFVVVPFRFLPLGASAQGKMRLEEVDLPPGTEILNAPPVAGQIVQGDWRMANIGLRFPNEMPCGVAFGLRAVVRNPRTNTVLEEHEWFGVCDSLPPLLASYSAILVKDGRVAIQVRAGDREAGMPEDGVTTEYSLDAGRTWVRKVHSPILDDFGRPTLFETVLGPFLPNADVLIGIRAVDIVGNVSQQLPSDARIWRAPPHAERVIDHSWDGLPDGNPIFAHSSISRSLRWVATPTDSQTPTRPIAMRDVTVTQRFELRRLRDLRMLGDSLRAWGVPLDEFAITEAAVDTFISPGGLARPILHLHR